MYLRRIKDIKKEICCDNKDCCQCQQGRKELLMPDSEADAQLKLELFEIKKKEFQMRHADVPYWIGMLRERRR